MSEVRKMQWCHFLIEDFVAFLPAAERVINNKKQSFNLIKNNFSFELMHKLFILKLILRISSTFNEADVVKQSL